MRRLALALLLAATGAGAAAAAPSATPAPQAVTLQHHGRAFELGVGRSVSVRLPSRRRLWSQPRAAGPGKVAISPVNYFRDPGFVEWRVTARAPGRVTLSSLGRCAECTPRVRGFRVTLVLGG